ncbi:MAG: hypothetical protein NT118_09625 [Lentisphaerae bacterium]|nr:hypothetical protein [Lentisphaerota bacterium]
MKNFLDFVFSSDNQSLFDFKCGYITATALILGLSILFLVLRFIYRYPRRMRGIEIKGPRGSIFITSDAISDLVKSIGEEYEIVEISKVHLLEGRTFSFIELQVILDNDGESSFLTLAEDIQNNILKTLSDRFGIDTVREVKLNLKKIESRKRSF